jgi:hypothetical protein
VVLLSSLKKRGSAFTRAPRPNRSALEMALALSLVAHRKCRCCKKFRHTLPGAPEIDVKKSGLYRSYFNERRKRSRGTDFLTIYRMADQR